MGRFVYHVILDDKVVETLPWGCGCGCIMCAADYARDVQLPAMVEKYGDNVKMKRVFHGDKLFSEEFCEQADYEHERDGDR